MRRYARFYADGQFRECGDAQRMALVSPSDGTRIGEVVACSAQDVELAVQSARAGFLVWSASSIDERRGALQRLQQELEARAEAATRALAEEMGCPTWLGRLMQLPMSLKGLQFAVEGLDQVQWRETIGNGLVERVPAGVIAAITPWNFPLHQIVAKVAAAIGAGCSVVLKPSEVAPGAAQLFMEAVHACNLPAGVVNMVWGGPDAGEQLVTHPGVDRISFTGSTAVGRKIMASAAQGLKPLTLELGGKSAAVLLDDADLDVAVPTAVRLAMANSGQTCVSQSRLIAPARLIPEIVERIRGAIAGWPVGDPREDSTRLGPVATQAQLQRVQRMIERARDQGAELLAGGPKPPAGFEQGWYVQPTLLGSVRPEMEIAQEEVFGPVLALIPYQSEEQATEIANGTRYGLSGAVWSRDAARATTFARRMITGQVVINGAAQNLATPFGGCGLSGYGRENGRFGIEELLSYRSLHGAA
ncbi:MULTISPECIES: aldehyde dehydrogenase family protein [unclassified Variovorax]|uniref:aldehyde dehydrogenase family protein n=1 Tax=unclassified Variovorax TaxID=663243 RepID=UPI00076DF09E|nr:MULTISPECIES: aldehyde dehydrogenase family protein [unclassified Variovorax]KWT70661.1 Aldehyde dehydrogenase [Variovorax sp. WDL1]PNG47124.1 3-succinoylsemialdehyde-pyridine dehydrogenase [Variovorax sp. B2]PNG48225.1 3-succinoylsemialdehyde-pyridine dehydrogenase [Variovorax sp. B4]VTV14991.1 3-succinoylsemialdehyde-pyridine dehydrogenase [Variovorax sp. WDL1]